MGKREPNDRTLKLLTVGMLLLTGFATAFHTIHMLVRNIRGRERDERRSDRRPPASTSPPAAQTPTKKPAAAARNGASGLNWPNASRTTITPRLPTATTPKSGSISQTAQCRRCRSG